MSIWNENGCRGGGAFQWGDLPLLEQGLPRVRHSEGAHGVVTALKLKVRTPLISVRSYLVQRKRSPFNAEPFNA